MTTSQLTPAQLNESRQPGLIVICTLAIALPSLALGLRIWSNTITQSYRWGWDDFFAAVSLPFTISLTGLMIWWTTLGLGRHQAAVPAEDLAEVPKIIFAGAFLYDCAISLPKFSALLFYHRIFSHTNPGFKVAIWIASALNAGWLISALLSTVFQCDPINAAWESVPGSKCISQSEWFLGTAIPSMIIDFCILVMPLPMLWGLQVPTSRRLKVVFVFLCGYAVIVVSIGRLVSLVQAGDELLEDVTWTTITYVQWLLCEGPISLISVCLPNIFRFLRHVNQQRSSRSYSGSRGKISVSSDSTISREGHFVRMDDYPSPGFVSKGRSPDFSPQEV